MGRSPGSSPEGATSRRPGVAGGVLVLALLALLVAGIGLAAFWTWNGGTGSHSDVVRGVERDSGGGAARPRTKTGGPSAATEHDGERLVRGRVVSAEDDEPIAGAQVELLTYRGQDQPLRRVARVRSDGDGRWQVTAPVRADDLYLSVRASARGWISSGPGRELVRGQWLPGVVRRDPRRLVPRPPESVAESGTGAARRIVELPAMRLRRGVRIAGRWCAELPASARGRVFADTTVAGPAGEQFQRDPVGALPDADGSFELWVEPGRTAVGVVFEAEAGADGERPVVALGESAELEVGDAGREDFEISPVACGLLTGHVVDAEGAPIPGALITAEALPIDGRISPLGERSAQSASDGTFRIAFPDERSAQLVITHPRFQERAIEVVVGEDLGEIPLERARWLVGRIELSARPGRDAPLPPVLRIGETWGTFAFERHGDRYRSVPIDPGADSGWLSVPGFLAPRVSWPDGTGEHDLGTIPLAVGVALDVLVVAAREREEVVGASPPEDAEDGVRVSGPIPSAQPVAGARVELRTSDGRPAMRAPSGTNGIASFAGLPACGVRIACRAPGYVQAVRLLDLAPAATAGGRTRTTLTLVEAAVISFRVVGIGARREVLAPAAVDVTLTPAVAVEPRAALSAAAEDSTARRQELALPGAPITVELSSPGWLPGTFEIDPLAPGEHRDVGTLELRRGGEVRVRLVDERGRPVGAGAVALDIEHSASETAGDPAAVSRSVRRHESSPVDERGRVHFSGLADGTYFVTVTCDEYAPVAPRRVRVAAGTEAELVIELEAGATFGGRITRRGEGPVARATVYLESIYWPKNKVAYSDAGGEFTLRGVPAGPLRLLVFDSSYGPDFTSSASGVGELPRDIELPGFASLEVDIECEAPIADGTPAELVLVGAGTSEGVVEGGRARFERLRPGDHLARLAVDAEGLDESAPFDLTLEEQQRAVARIELPVTVAGVELEVRVSQDSGEAVPEVAVFAAPAHGPLSPWSPGAVRATVSGGVARLAVPSSWTEMLLGARAPGFLPAHLDGTLRDFRSSPPTLILERAAHLTVRLHAEEGSPEAAKQFTVRHRATGKSVTGPLPGDLEFFECDMAPGVVEVVVAVSGGETVQESVELFLGVSNELDIDLPGAPIEVSGRVWVGGVAVAGGTLLAQLRSGEAVRSGHSTANRPAPVSSDGRYVLRLSTPGWYEVHYIDDTVTGSDLVRWVEIRASRELDFAWASASLTARVVGPAGGPLAGVGVSLEGAATVRVLSDGEGAIHLPNLPEGDYRWRVESGRQDIFGAGRLHLSGPTQLELRTERGRRLEVRLHGPSGASRWTLDLIRPDGPLRVAAASGAAASLVLPLGAHTLEVAVREGALRARRDVVIAAGTDWLEFDPTPAAILTVAAAPALLPPGAADFTGIPVEITESGSDAEATTLHLDRLGRAAYRTGTGPTGVTLDLRWTRADGTPRVRTLHLARGAAQRVVLD